jgi:ABC-type Fe3+/spermidine/putrescine transport system ATPase subunit
VAVMNEGRLDQVDPPAVLYRTPVTSFVAGFVGRVNVLAGTVQGHNLRLGPAMLPLPLPGADPEVDGRRQENLLEGPVEVAVRPEEVALVPTPPDVSGHILLEAEVVRTVSRGHFDEVLVTTVLGPLRAYVAAGAYHSGEVAIHLGRMLLYQSGRLVGTLRGDGPGTASAPPNAAREL